MRQSVAAFSLCTRVDDYAHFLIALLRDPAMLATIADSPVEVEAGLNLSWGLGRGLVHSAYGCIFCHGATTRATARSRCQWLARAMAWFCGPTATPARSGWNLSRVPSTDRWTPRHGLGIERVSVSVNVGWWPGLPKAKVSCAASSIVMTASGR
jgi:hypothetical protein